MFTGLVEEIGTVTQAGSGILGIRAKLVLEDMKPGSSIAVNGACLTVTSIVNNSFFVDVMPETRQRTNLGRLFPGGKVNLERPVKLGGYLGGHLVQGHVDGLGKVLTITDREGARLVRILTPEGLMGYVVEKGFIAVDGVSLTVVNQDSYSFTVSLVAYTLKNTTLGEKKPGDLINLEVDIIAKYLGGLRRGNNTDKMIQDFLKEFSVPR